MALPQPLASWRTKLNTVLLSSTFRRYLLVGAFNTAFGYAVYVALTALLMPYLTHGYLVASLLGSLLSITVSFFNHKLFVFRTKGNWLQEWWRCLAVYGTSMVLGLFALPPLVWGCTWATGDAASAPYLAGAIWLVLNLGWNFLGHKHFAFAPRHGSARPVPGSTR